MSKNSEPETMKRLHSIREAHYEVTKENNLKDVLNDIHRQAEKIIKKYRLNLPVLEQTKV
ncbi:MAG: hypothetical protein AAB019_08215 [Planctomycetota bacterium]